MNNGAEVHALLKSMGVTPSRARGQSFLLDQHFSQLAVQFSGLTANDSVIEIGPGLGCLTECLLAQAREVKVVEIERQFVDYLKKRFVSLKPENFHCRDIRQIRLSEFEKPEAGKWVLFGNVPYSISSDVVFWAIENRAHIAWACFLFQTEFARRLAADPGTKDYGSLTVKRMMFADAELGPSISGTEFYPQAAVDSTLIKLTFLAQPRISLENSIFEKVVLAAFSTRRKTLLNCLVAQNIVASKEEGAKLLATLQIDCKRRGETLSFVEFTQLALSIENMNKNPRVREI